MIVDLVRNDLGRIARTGTRAGAAARRVRAVRAGLATQLGGRGVSAGRHRSRRRADGAVPERLDHRRAQAGRDGCDRRTRGLSAWRLLRCGRMGRVRRTPRCAPASASRSARSWSTGGPAAPATAPAAGSPSGRSPTRSTTNCWPRPGVLDVTQDDEPLELLETLACVGGVLRTASGTSIGWPARPRGSASRSTRRRAEGVAGRRGAITGCAAAVARGRRRCRRGRCPPVAVDRPAAGAAGRRHGAGRRRVAVAGAQDQPARRLRRGARPARAAPTTSCSSTPTGTSPRAASPTSSPAWTAVVDAAGHRRVPAGRRTRGAARRRRGRRALADRRRPATGRADRARELTARPPSRRPA